MNKRPIADSEVKPASGVAPSLTELSLSAVKWNYLGVVARIIFQLAAQIVLARLLGPESFGLFAAAFLVIGIGNILAEMGLGSALVQKKKLSEADVRFVFTWVCLAGVLMSGITYLLADVIAQFFEDERIASVMRGLSPVFILQSLSIVPLALLKRDLEFKTIQIVQVLSYLIGYMLVGVGFALAGAGVTSLVAAWIGQSALSAALFYSFKRHPMKPIILGEGHGLKKFGIRALFTNMANWAIGNVDNLLVGKVFGPTALGLYSVSYNLVRTPADHLVVTLQTVLFPASARAQDNLDSLRRAYLIVVAAVSLVAFPVFAGIAAVTDTLIAALFGPQWVAAGPVLLPLSLSMILHAVMAVAGPVLWGKGAVGAELRVQFWVGVIFVVALLVASRYSVTAMAWAVCGVYGLRVVGMTVVLMRHIELSAHALLGALRGGVLSAMLVVFVLFVVDRTLLEWTPMLILAVEIALSGMVLTGFVLGFPHLALSNDLLVVTQKLLSGIPLGHSVLVRRILSIRPVSSL